MVTEPRANASPFSARPPRRARERAPLAEHPDAEIDEVSGAGESKRAEDQPERRLRMNAVAMNSDR
jgi:hypothetical protein